MVIGNKHWATGDRQHNRYTYIYILTQQKRIYIYIYGDIGPWLLVGALGHPWLSLGRPWDALGLL